MVNLKKTSGKTPIKITDINYAISRENNNPLLYAKRANFFQEEKKYAKALADINRALELDPNNNEFLFRKALILRDAGNDEQALEAAEEAENLGYKGPEVFILQSELFIRLKNYSNSLEKVNIALESAPFNEFALFYKGFAQAEKGDTAFAVINYRRAIKNAPAFISPHLQLASIYNAKKDFNLSQRYIKNAEKLDNNNSFLWFQKGIRYKILKQIDSAFVCLSKAVAKDKNLYLAHYQLGLLEFNRKNYAGAATHMAAAITQSENLNRIREILAESLEKSGQYNLAIKEYNKILNKNPGDIWAGWGVRRSNYAIYKTKRDSLRKAGNQIYTLEEDTTNFNF
ncbi:tetratricopeptide repeat protein [Adhaeribacter aquaticus]|uniref:tetratricopeptide repeat protein n=1 Tax=Adhaeribacter aquaticus TaxID=299567 RepID=UPI000410C4C7|nr:tetratricopeptide repeat protein [Adhaeribacter aquaticus]